MQSKRHGNVRTARPPTSRSIEADAEGLRAVCSAIRARTSRAVTRTRRRGKEREVDHVPLGVAPAHDAGPWPDVHQPVDSQVRRPERQGDEPFEQVHPRPVDGSAICSRRPVSVGHDEPVGQVPSTRQSEGHHCVPVVEEVDRLADQRLDGCGEGQHAVPDVHSEQRKPPEQRGGVDEVEPNRRSARPDRPVVECDDVVELAHVEIEEPPVPPVVDREVAVAPVRE